MSKEHLNILLVDDDEDDFIMTRDLLQDVGADLYQMEWVSTFEEALQRIDRQHFDLCLFDYRLGQHDGLELLREVLRRGHTVPIILLTGQGDKEVDHEAMKAGAADYLIKGEITEDALERAIRYAVERHRIEAALRSSQKEVLNQNKELEEAYQQLKASQSRILQQEKMASIGQLAAGVAHEINNPMGFIASNLRTLGKYSSKLSDFIKAQTQLAGQGRNDEITRQLEEQKKTLKIDYVMEDIGDLIEESLEGAERVRQIVMNLKNFSRIDENELKAADLNECLESTLNIIWNEIKYKAEVSKEYGKLPETFCYPQQLNQVFMNLLVNASQAIDGQGNIRLKTWQRKESIYLSIADTGKGIDPEKIGRIFEPFFTTKEVGEGTGLGLSIVYEIIKKHDGEITVESEVGRGTEFVIRMPIRTHSG